MDAAPTAAQPPVTKTKTTILHQFHVLVLWHVWHWWWWDWCKLLATSSSSTTSWWRRWRLSFPRCNAQLSNSITQFHSFVFVKDRYRAIDGIFSAATTTTAHTSSSSSHWWTRRAVSHRTNNVSTQQLTMRARATATATTRERERERESE